MFGYYLVGYIAVAASYYWRTYRTAPVIEDMESPRLTLWVNPEMEQSQETWQEEPLRKAA